MLKWISLSLVCGSLLLWLVLQDWTTGWTPQKLGDATCYAAAFALWRVGCGLERKTRTWREEG